MLRTNARRANLRAREMIDEVAAGEDDFLWAFFCECGDAECAAVVELTAAQFDRLLEAGEGEILSEAHISRGRPRRLQSSTS